MSLGGSLRGTLPNPDFSANGLIEAQVFGARSSGSSSIPLSEEETVQIVELVNTYGAKPYSYNPADNFYDLHISHGLTLGSDVNSSNWDISPTGSGQFPQLGFWTTGQPIQMALGRYSNDTAATALAFIKSRSAVVGTNTIVQNGDTLGNFVFRGADGTNYKNSSAIQAFVDAAPSAGIVPGRVIINTTNTSGTLTEAIRIDSAQALSIAGKILKIAGISSSGIIGVPLIVATGRSTAQTAAVTSVSTFTVGTSAGSFEVSANVLVTTATAHNFTVTCAYTDEGNTARTLTFGFTQLTGSTFITAITNLTGTGPYESPVFHLRCKASTAITIATKGTFTTVTYNVEGIIKQTA